MKRLIFFAIIAILCGTNLRAQQTDTLFPYPTINDENATLTERCNYLVYNFWNRCNIKQSFSSMARLNDAFGTWASFMPYASADTVHMAIDNYIKAVEKEAPKNMLEVGEMARNWFFCDSAEYISDELFIPFCRAVANSKKVPGQQKAKYQAELKILESSGLGQRVPNITFTKPDGSKGAFDDILASRIVLFFTDPDCIDCGLMRVRLATDYDTNQLIDKGLIKVVCLYAGEPTEAWKAEAERCPKNWIVGANKNISEYFDLKNMPTLYWLDGRHKVLGKDANFDSLLFALRKINNN